MMRQTFRLDKAAVLTWIITALTCFASGSAFANRVISTPGKAAVVVSQQSSNHRLCYYEDKSYSLGAVLEVSGVLIECKAEKEFELNGSLQWVQIKKKDK